MSAVRCGLCLLVLLVSATGVRAAERRPNFVIVFTDDQGCGDLGCYGSKAIRSPRVDQLAKEGARFTSFYAQVVCGPSRSALLTGRYPNCSRGWSMPAGEITIASCSNWRTRSSLRRNWARLQSDRGNGRRPGPNREAGRAGRHSIPHP